MSKWAHTLSNKVRTALGLFASATKGAGGLACALGGPANFASASSARALAPLAPAVPLLPEPPFFGCAFAACLRFQSKNAFCSDFWPSGAEALALLSTAVKLSSSFADA